MNTSKKTKDQLVAELAQLDKKLKAETAKRLAAEQANQQAQEALRRQNEYVATLQETTLGLIRRLDVSGLLETIITRAGLLAGTSHGYIYLLEPDGTRMTLQVGIGVQSESVGHQIKPGEGIAGRVWQSGQPLVIKDYKNWAGRPPGFERSVLQSAVGMPLKSGTHVVGVIGLAYLEKDRQITTEETNILTQFAELASIALDNAQLFRATQTALSDTEALYHAARSIGQATTPEAVGQALMDYAATSGMDSARLLYFEHDKQGQPTHLIMREGWTADERPTQPYGTRLAIQDYLLADFMDRSHPTLVEDALTDPKVKEIIRNLIVEISGLHSFAMLPIATHARWVGILLIGRHRPSTFADSLMGGFRTLAGQAATTFETLRLFKEARRRATQLQTASEVSRAASSILSLEQLLPQVVELICERFGLYYVGIFLVDEAGEWAVLRAGTGEAGQKMLRGGHKLLVGGVSMIGLCVANAKGRIALDVGQEAERFDNPNLPDTRSELALPLISHGQAIGAMTVQSAEPLAFTDEDISTLQTMADQVANAIENARLFEDSRRRIAELATLNKIGETFSTALQAEELPELIYQQIGNTFQSDSFYIALYDAKTDEWTTVFDVIRGQQQPPIRRARDMGLTGHIIRTRQPLLMSNLEENAATYEKLSIQRIGEQAKSWMGVPLIAANEVVGVMAIESYERENLYSQPSLNLFSTIAAQVANAIKNAQLFQETKQRVTELSIINEISQALSTALGLNQVLETIFWQVSRTFDTTSFFIAAYEEGSDEWEMAFQRGPDHGTRHKLGIGFTGHVLTSRRSLLLCSAQETQAFAQQYGIQRTGLPAKSWMGVPLITAGKVVGAMVIQSYEQENLFSQQDLALFSTIAAQAANTIQNARLFEQTRQRVTELSILNEISQALSSALDLNQLLETVYHQVSRVFDTTNFFIATYEEGSPEWLMAFQTEQGQRMPSGTRKIGVGFTSYVLVNRRSLLLKTAQETTAFVEQQNIQRLGPPARCWMGIPLIAGGRLVGAMAIQSYEQENIYAQNELALFSIIGAQVAIAVQNARLFTETRERIAELSALNEISRAFSATLTVNELLEAAYLQLGNIFSVANCCIATCEARAEEWTAAFHMERDQRQPALRRPLKMGLPGYIIRARQPVLLLNQHEGLTFEKTQAIEPLGETPQSFLGVPLVAADQVVGAMTVYSYERENFYTSHDLELFATIGAQIAIAIQNTRLFEETNQRVAELAILNEISRTFSASLALDELVKVIHHQVGRIFNASNFYIALYKEGEEEWLSAFHLERGEWQPTARRKLGTGLTGYIIQTRRPLLFRTAAEDVAFLEQQGIEHLGELAKSWMGVPLIAAGMTVGVMAIQSYEQENLYDDQDMALFSTIAAQAAVAIQNARLFEETQNRVEQTQLLLRVSEASASTLDRVEVMRRVAREAARAVNADMSGAYLLDETGKRLRPVAGYHVPPELLEQHMNYHPLLEGNLFAEEAYKNRRTVFSADMPNDARIDPEIRQMLDAQSVMLAPMVAKETVIGGFWLVWWQEAHRFSEDERRLVEGIVRQAAVAVDNARLFSETQTRAQQMASLNELAAQITDPQLNLTELLEKIAHRAEAILATDQAGIWLPVSNDEIELVVTTQAELKNRRLKKGQGLSGQVLAGGVPLRIDDYSAWSGMAPSFKDAAIRAALAVPLVWKEQILGVLTLTRFRTANLFTADDEQLAQLFAAQAAAAIENTRLFEETSRRAEEMAVLNELSRKLTARLDVDRVLDETYRGISRLIDTTNFYIGLYNPAKEEITFPLNVTESVVDKSIAVIPASSGMSGYVLRNRLSVLIKENLADWQREHGIAVVGEMARSWLGVPLTIGDQVIGVMAVQSYTTLHAYDEHDQELMVAFASQAAIAIQNARLFEETRRRAEEMAVLNEFSRTLTARLDVDQVLTETYQGISRLIDTVNFYISMYDPDKNQASFPFQVADGKRIEPEEAQPVFGLTGYLIRTKQPLLIQDNEGGKAAQRLGVDYYSFAGKEPCKSWLGAPMLVGGQVIGAIVLLDYDHLRAFDEHDQELLTTIAGQVAITLQNARLFEEQRQARALLLTRVKELDCLNDLGRKINETPPVAEFLQWAAERIPAAMQYSELCRVTIKYEGQIYGDVEATQMARQMVSSLQIGDETVGQVYIAYTESRDFMHEESALLGDIGRRISGYIENRRLLQETQSRAQREQHLREITTHVRASTDPDTIVRTAVRELGAALGRPAFIRLGNADELSAPPLTTPQGDN